MLCVNVRFRGIATRSLEGTLGEVLSLLCSPHACPRTCVSRRMRANNGANPKGSKDERSTDSSSHPHGRVADFDLGTQQNMEKA